MPASKNSVQKTVAVQRTETSKQLVKDILGELHLPLPGSAPGPFSSMPRSPLRPPLSPDGMSVAELRAEEAPNKCKKRCIKHVLKIIRWSGAARGNSGARGELLGTQGASGACGDTRGHWRKCRRPRGIRESGNCPSKTLTKTKRVMSRTNPPKAKYQRAEKMR